MEEFFHIRPPLALLARFERFLAGLAGGPPFLRARVGRYQRHVGIEVVSDILEVGKQKAVLVVDRVVANPGSRAKRRRAAVCILRIFPVLAGSLSRSVSWDGWMWGLNSQALFLSL